MNILKWFWIIFGKTSRKDCRWRECVIKLRQTCGWRMQLRADWIFFFFYVTKLGRVIKSMAWCPCACESRPQDNRNMKSTWLCWWFIFWSTCVNGNGRLHDDANRMLNIKKKETILLFSFWLRNAIFYSVAMATHWSRADQKKKEKAQSFNWIRFSFSLSFLGEDTTTSQGYSFGINQQRPCNAQGGTSAEK